MSYIPLCIWHLCICVDLWLPIIAPVVWLIEYQTRVTVLTNFLTGVLIRWGVLVLPSWSGGGSWCRPDSRVGWGTWSWPLQWADQCILIIRLGGGDYVSFNYPGFATISPSFSSWSISFVWDVQGISGVLWIIEDSLAGRSCMFGTPFCNECLLLCHRIFERVVRA